MLVRKKVSSDASLNGMEGLTEGQEPDGRYLVRLLSNNKLLKIREDKMELFQPNDKPSRSDYTFTHGANAGGNAAAINEMFHGGKKSSSSRDV